MMPTLLASRVQALLAAGGRPVDEASCARELALLESLPLARGDPVLRLRQAALLHALAELRDEPRHAEAARGIYHELLAGGLLPPGVAQLVEELLTDAAARAA